MNFITLNQASRIIGLSPITLRVYAQTGQLPAVKVGNTWAVLRKDAEGFVVASPDKRCSAFSDALSSGCRRWAKWRVRVLVGGKAQELARCDTCLARLEKHAKAETAKFTIVSVEPYHTYHSGKEDYRMRCPKCNHYPMDQRSVLRGNGRAEITYTCPKCSHVTSRDVSVPE